MLQPPLPSFFQTMAEALTFAWIPNIFLETESHWVAQACPNPLLMWQLIHPTPSASLHSTGIPGYAIHKGQLDLQHLTNFRSWTDHLPCIQLCEKAVLREGRHLAPLHFPDGKMREVPVAFTSNKGNMAPVCLLVHSPKTKSTFAFWVRPVSSLLEQISLEMTYWDTSLLWKYSHCYIPKLISRTGRS